MEARLFDEGTIPEWTTSSWYSDRSAAPHLEEEGHAQRLMLSASQVNHAVALGAQTFSDLGAGDGGLLSLVALPNDKKWGYDLQQSNVDASAARGVSVHLQDVTNLDRVSLGECVALTEVLEHMLEPRLLLHRLHQRSGVKWIVASSPYTETAESHYQFHCWAWDLDGYRDMFLETGWTVVAQETAWICTSLLAARP